MNYTKLEKNLINVMKEAQIKLGYDGNALRMNYTVSSLNNLLDTDLSAGEMKDALSGFCRAVEDRLGGIDVTVKDENILTFCIPAQGTQYVHDHIDSSEFIVEFINAVGGHDCTMEKIIGIFRRHSDKVHIEQIDNDEFNYLIYFEDGVPDDFLYCINDDGLHITYHRFTEADYHDFGF